MQGSEWWTAPPYLMWVAGRLSYCRDRKSSLWRSWCFCLSVRSASAGLSFSSSSSSARRQQTHAVKTLHRYRREGCGLSGGASGEATGAAEARPLRMHRNQMIAVDLWPNQLIDPLVLRRGGAALKCSGAGLQIGKR